MLISVGEEGVVVFWHLNTDKKDFLPRFGSEILGVMLSQDGNKLVCYLSDNSIKVVQLDQDKSIVHLKTILNPNGVKTKRSLIEDYKFLGGVFYNKEMNLLCMNSVPGKLQFVSPYRSLRSIPEELDITNRNFVSRLDNNYPDPVEVKCISLTSDWKILGVYADSGCISYLKFYEL